MLLIRVDANYVLGGGHLFRCLAVAERARDAGRRVLFLVNGDIGPMVSIVVDRGFEVGYQSGASGSSIDAGELMLAITRFDPQAVLIDGVHYRPELCGALSDIRATVAQFVDSPEDALPETWLVNPSPSAQASDYRAGRHFFGPEFAALRTEVVGYGVFARQSARAPRASTPRILVTMGASDPVGATARVVASLAHLQAPARIATVTGPGFREFATLERVSDEALARGHAVEHIRDPRDLAFWIAASDCAISSAGGTVAELAYLGCPTLCFSTVRNQLANGEAWGKTGSVEYAGHLPDLSQSAAIETILSFVDDSARQGQLRERSLETIDGQGAHRLVSELFDEAAMAVDAA